MKRTITEKILKDFRESSSHEKSLRRRTLKMILSELEYAFSGDMEDIKNNDSNIIYVISRYKKELEKKLQFNVLRGCSSRLKDEIKIVEEYLPS